MNFDSKVHSRISPTPETVHYKLLHLERSHRANVSFCRTADESFTENNNSSILKFEPELTDSNKKLADIYEPPFTEKITQCHDGQVTLVVRRTEQRTPLKRIQQRDL